jgi:hypothetical protein
VEFSSCGLGHNAPETSCDQSGQLPTQKNGRFRAPCADPIKSRSGSRFRSGAGVACLIPPFSKHGGWRRRTRIREDASARSNPSPSDLQRSPWRTQAKSHRRSYAAEATQWPRRLRRAEPRSCNMSAAGISCAVSCSDCGLTHHDFDLLRALQDRQGVEHSSCRLRRAFHATPRSSRTLAIFVLKLLACDY